MSKRYYLFTNEECDQIRLDFPPLTIERFIQLWNNDVPFEKIFKTLRIKPVEAALIMIDLEYSGRITSRKQGLDGKELTA